MKTVIKLLKRELQKWNEFYRSEKLYQKTRVNDKDTKKNIKDCERHIAELEQAILKLKNVH